MAQSLNAGHGRRSCLTATGLLILLALAALPCSHRRARARTLPPGISRRCGIFIGSYPALAIGKVPGLSIDRAGVALVGASLMVASGVVSLDDAYQAVDIGYASPCCSA